MLQAIHVKKKTRLKKSLAVTKGEKGMKWTEQVYLRMFCCDFAKIEKPKWRNALWFSIKIGLALKELISNADQFSLKSLGKTFLNWTSVSSTIEIKLRKEEFFPYFLNLLSSEHLGILEKMEHECIQLVISVYHIGVCP